jgi:methyl-accepting chemotaxis protein
VEETETPMEEIETLVEEIETLVEDMETLVEDMETLVEDMETLVEDMETLVEETEVTLDLRKCIKQYAQIVDKIVKSHSNQAKMLKANQDPFTVEIASKIIKSSKIDTF